MDISEKVVFLPVSDIETYEDWDEESGFGGTDQILDDDGIFVSTKREAEFKAHLVNFEKYATSD